MAVELDTAANADELRQKLRVLGVAGAREATVIQGLDGAHDMGVVFPDAQLKVKGVGFRSRDIPLNVVHQIMTELTVLERRSPVTDGGRTVTQYGGL